MGLAGWLQQIVLPTGGTMAKYCSAVCIFSPIAFIFICLIQFFIFRRVEAEVSAKFSLQAFYSISFSSGIVFGTIFFLSLTASFTSKENQRICSMSSCAVSFIAACSQFLAGFQVSPVSFHNNPYNVIIHVRWAEWMICVPLLIFILGHVTQVRPLYVFCGMLLQFFVILLGYIAELSPTMSMQLCFFVLSFSLWVFLMICIFTLSVTLSAHRFAMQQSRRTQAITLDQTMIKVLGCSAISLWLLYPALFILFITGILSSRMYLLSSPVADVFCKTIFIAILNAVHSEGEIKRIEAVLQELKTDNEIQGKFLRFVYHEIRNPFNSIMLGLNHLEEETILLPYRELIAMLRRSAAAMKRVIDDVVDLTQARDLQISSEPVSIEAVLDSAVETFGGLVSDKAIRVQKYVASTLPAKLLADSLKLKKIFEVLLSNAIKFSPVGSTVTVALQVLDITFGICTLCFSVKDKGSGISDNIAPLLFQPFAVVRPGDFSEDENRGSGLGLCFAKHLADLMNGTLTFKNNSEGRLVSRRSHGQDQGTTFSLTIALDICPPEENNGAPSWNYWTPRRLFPSSGSRGSVVSRTSAINLNRITNHNSMCSSTSQVVPQNLQLSLIPPAKHQASQSKCSSLCNSFGAKSTSRKSRSRFLSNVCSSEKGEIDASVSPENALSLSSMHKATLGSQNNSTNNQKHLPMFISNAKPDIPDSNFHSILANELNMESVGKMLDIEHSFQVRKDHKAIGDAPLPLEKVHSAERNFPPSLSLHTLRPSFAPATARESSRAKYELSVANQKLSEVPLYTAQARKSSRVTFEGSTSLDGQNDQRMLISRESRINDAKRHHLPFPLLKMRPLVDVSLHQFNPIEADEDCFVQEAPQVLIVDDVKSNQKLVHLILQKAGYVCDIASTGLEAVALARQHQYKLIIMDNVMPIMNGVEATKRILAFDKTVAIVGLTGNILQSDQQEFMNAGVKLIIEKPANKTRLLEVCKQFVPLPPQK